VGEAFGAHVNDQAARLAFTDAAPFAALGGALFFAALFFAAGAGVADENLVAIADIQPKAGVPVIPHGGPAAGRLRDQPGRRAIDLFPVDAE